MTLENRERLNWLCGQIQGEKNHQKLGELVAELYELLDNRSQPTSNKAFETET